MCDMLVSDFLSIFRFLTMNSVLSLFGVGELSEYILFFGSFMYEVSKKRFCIFVRNGKLAHNFASFSKGIAAWGAHYNSNQI